MEAPLLCLESTVAIEELEQVRFIVDIILFESRPSPASRKQHLDAIGDGVEMEVGKFVDPERGIRYAFREQRPLFGVSASLPARLTTQNKGDTISLVVEQV